MQQFENQEDDNYELLILTDVKSLLVPLGVRGLSIPSLVVASGAKELEKEGIVGLLTWPHTSTSLIPSA